MCGMLINFIGSPSSGKTTVAAMTFARLKEVGVPCEFVAEQARAYIAELRVRQKLEPSSPLKLWEHDQLEILSRQVAVERTMSLAVGDEAVVISDSSPLNSLLYMSEESREKVGSVAREGGDQADLIFHCSPVPIIEYGSDPCRVHSVEEWGRINAAIAEVMARYAPEAWRRAVPLSSDPQRRFSEVVAAVLKLRFNC